MPVWTVLNMLLNVLFQVAWRPFHIQSYVYQGCSVRKVLNILYTLFIFFLIIFSYASSVIACQARLEIRKEVCDLVHFACVDCRN